MTLLSLAAVAAFVLVHVFVGKLRFLEGVPRSRWLSMAGGVAVAYVFLHVLPDLGERQRLVDERAAIGEAIRAELYLVALAGLAVFYGLERHIRAARSRTGGAKAADASADAASEGAFWLHAGSFALYNVLIGYLLLHREQAGAASLATYALAMALHFVTNDYGLRLDYRADYDRHARWMLAAAVVAGWVLGLFFELSELTVALLFAFLSGGVVLNVLKEELPEDRSSRFGPFAAGAVGYALVLQWAG